MNELMKVHEVAKALRLSARTVYEMVRSGELPALRLRGRSWRVRAEDLQRLQPPPPGASAVPADR